MYHSAKTVFERELTVDEDPLEDEGISFHFDDTLMDEEDRGVTGKKGGGKKNQGDEDDDIPDEGSLLATKNGQDEMMACSICGFGLVVTNPDAKGVDPAYQSITCGQLEILAQQGMFNAWKCQELEDLSFEACGCVPASDVQDSPPNGVSCSICGEGLIITKSNAVGIDPDDESITCGKVQRAADNGLFTDEECRALQGDKKIYEVCKCEPDPAFQDSSKKIACSICGEGLVVSNADATGLDPDEAWITCGKLQESAKNSMFTAKQCQSLLADTDILAICECIPDPAAQALVETGRCSICGKGFAVSDPTAVGIDPADNDITCGKVQEAAKNGILTEEECKELQNEDVFKTCKCVQLDLALQDESTGKKLPCSICPKGYVMTKPRANGIDPVDETITCEQVQEAAQDGKFSATECKAFLDDQNMFDVCGCSSESDLETISCSICGEDYVVTNPKGTGIYPADSSITCGQVQKAAEEGEFTASECSSLVANQDINKICVCEEDPRRRRNPSPSPTTRVSSPATIVCSICGDHFVVSKLDETGIDPEDDSITCGDVQKAAENSMFTAVECHELMTDNNLYTKCGCVPDPADSSTIGVQCSICGEDYVVSNADVSGLYPGDDLITCGQLQEWAEDGNFTAEECRELMTNENIINECGCEPDPRSQKATTAPVASPVLELNDVGCELMVTVKCVPPEHIARDTTCEDYLIPNINKDCVETPTELAFIFDGGLCPPEKEVHDLKNYKCQDFEGSPTIEKGQTVYIEVHPSNARVGDAYFKGNVTIGDTMIISSIRDNSDDDDDDDDDNDNGAAKFGEIAIFVYESVDKAKLVQLTFMGAQCDDLILGNEYGAFQLVSISNKEVTASVYKNVFYEVTITNPMPTALYVEHAIVIVDETSSHIVDGGRGKDEEGAEQQDLVLLGRGDRPQRDATALTLVHEFNIDTKHPRVISTSATVMGRDDEMNTCAAFGQLFITIPGH